MCHCEIHRLPAAAPARRSFNVDGSFSDMTCHGYYSLQIGKKAFRYFAAIKFFEADNSTDVVKITPPALKDSCQKSPIQFENDYTTSCGCPKWGFVYDNLPLYRNP